MMKDKKIRFIDSHYNTLFYVEDGDEVTIKYDDGQEITKTCKYIDEYHFRFGSNPYHICEFAERMERVGGKYNPVKGEKM